MACLVKSHDMAARGGATALLKVGPKGVLNQRLKLSAISFCELANFCQQRHFHLSGKFLTRDIHDIMIYHEIS